MLHAVLYALGDSVNALLIGILVAIGIMLPPGKYRKVATLVVAGDWLGVVAAAAAVLFFLLGIRERIQQVLESPVAGIVLIVVGVALGIGAWRSQGKPNDLVRRLMGPLEEPSATTVGIGFAMGVIQSLTSVPFYYGLMFLAASDIAPGTQYVGLVLYATLALSLPVVCGLFIALVRARPDSGAGRAFQAARRNSARVALWGGYAVAVFLIVMGGVALL